MSTTENIDPQRRRPGPETAQSPRKPEDETAALVSFEAALRRKRARAARSPGDDDPGPSAA